MGAGARRHSVAGLVTSALDSPKARNRGFAAAVASLLALALALRVAAVWITPVAFFVVAAVTAGALRYRARLDLFFIMAAAPFVVALWDRVRARKRRAN